MKKVVIIGGMASGCKTAVRLKRLKPEYQITILEKRDILSFGTCGMPFYASGDVDDFYDLTKTPYDVFRDDEFFRYTKGVEALTEVEVVQINPEKKEVLCKDLASGDDTLSFNYDELVFATGSVPILPQIDIPKSDRICTFHHPEDARQFKELAESGKIGKVVIVGAGYIGCELAEAMLAMWGIETTLVEKESQIMPQALDIEMANILQKILEAKGTNIKLNTSLSGLSIVNDECLVQLDTGEQIDCDYVFLCTGIKPNVELAKQLGVDIGKNGGILVNDRFQTSKENIWAVGDCVEIKNVITGEYDYFAFGSLANKEARILADNIAGIERSFRGATGANSIKVFDFVVGSVGLTEKKAKRYYDDISSVIGTWYDRPDYHPDVKTTYGKLIYRKSNMQILGLQLMGFGEVTRYIDAFSAILSKGGATIEDLIQFEHCYTPPHSSPINTLNNLGFMAENQERFGIECIKNLDRLNEFDLILDVREEAEISQDSFIANATRINLSQLRYKIKELDKSKSVIVFCQKGSRSYEACKILKDFGFNRVAYLGGGVEFFK